MVCSLLCSILLPALPQSVGVARSATRVALHGTCEPDTLASAMVVASELASNSVRYAGKGTPAPDATHLVSRFSLAIFITTGGSIRLELDEIAGQTTPEVIKPDDSSLNGRGLYMVDRLTSGQWGWSDYGGIRRIWATIG